MNFIFLDIDGVLNSEPFFEEQKKKFGGELLSGKFNEICDLHVQMLAKIYHACDAKIVLSSTWRDLDDPTDSFGYSRYKYLFDKLAEQSMEIFSKTPVIEYNRPLEIKTWLDEFEEDCNFVILDDDFNRDQYDEYGLGDHLVHTIYFCENMYDGGLQQRHVDRAIQILKKGTS